MSDDNDDKLTLYGSNVIGPFEEPVYKVAYDGFVVPNLTARKGNGEDRWALVLDGRFVSEYVPRAEVHRWVSFIAHAQAIGAGYPCHGATEKTSPFACRISGIELERAEKPS